MSTSADQKMAQPAPCDFGGFMSRISDMIAQRLSESGEYSISLNDIAGDIADQYRGVGTDEFEFQDLLADLLQDLLQPLIYIGNDDLGGESIEVLVLGTDHVFSVLHQTGLEPVLGVAASLRDPDAMIAEAQFRIRHCLSWTPISFPDQITFAHPLTSQDVLNAIELALYDGPTIELAPQGSIHYQGYLDAFRTFIASQHPEDPKIELSDFRSIASRYADLVVKPDCDDPCNPELWRFDPPDYYIDAIEERLRHPATPIPGEPKAEIGLEDTLRPTRDGILVDVDPNKPGAKEAMRRALFGS